MKHNERAHLRAVRDRLCRKMDWADEAREQAAERVAFLAVEIAKIDRRLAELDRPEGGPS